MNDKPKDYMSVQDLLKEPYCPFSRGSLYALIRRGKKNGLSSATFKVGRKIIISRAGFIRWLASHRTV